MKKFFFAASISIVAVGAAKAQQIPSDINKLLQNHTCYTCHAVSKKMVGPTWKDIAAKKYTEKQFAQLVAKPKPSNWPNYPAMAALPNVPKGDLKKISDWVNTLNK